MGTRRRASPPPAETRSRASNADRQVTKQIMTKWLLHELIRWRAIRLLSACVMRTCLALASPHTIGDHADKGSTLSRNMPQLGVGADGPRRQTQYVAHHGRQSRWRTMLPSSISISGSQTTLSSLLSKMSNAAAGDTEVRWEHVNCCLDQPQDGAHE